MGAKDQGKAEVIEFNGIKFRRYPKSLRWTCRNYYTPNATYRKRGVGCLHREIWKEAHGPIPDGCEIHHKDGNPLNNALDNLQCVTAAEHKAIHRIWEESPKRKAMRAAQLHEKAREAARAWHKSEEGHAWHKQLGAMSAEARYPVTKQCEHCGATYETDNVAASVSRFCSINCKAAARRASGVDNEERTCVHCGAVFSVNRYSPVKFCSRSCRGLSQRRRESRTCPICGSTFVVIHSHSKRYCSLDCAYQGMWHQEEAAR